MNILNTILDRLAENSTWRGIIFVLTALGLKLEPSLQDQIIVAGLSLVGVLNIVRKEKK